MRTRHSLTGPECEALEWEAMGCPNPSPVHSSKTPDYPLTTEQVVAQLRKRGFNVDFFGLSYLVRKGKVTPTREGQKNYRWDEADVEIAVDHFEQERQWLNSYLAADSEGYDPMQERLAFSVAFRRTHIQDHDRLVMVILPAPVLSGERRKVVYLSPQEFEEGCKTGLAKVVESAVAQSDTDALMERHQKHKKQEQRVRSRK